MGRPLSAKYFGNPVTSATNRLTFSTCWVPGDTAVSSNCYIVKQIGTSRFVANSPDTGNQGIVALQLSTPTAAGQAQIFAGTSSESGTGADIIPVMELNAVSGNATAVIGTSYVPADVLTMVGGTGTAATVTVTNTQVVSATIAAAGTGGTPGTATVTGTTGTGTKFTASVTISAGGVVTAVLSILTGGIYTVNPTVLTAEPVTGGSLTGTQLAVHMGPNACATTGTKGAYTILPANVAAVTTTGGTGTGAVLTTTYDVASVTLTGGNGGQGYHTGDTLTFTGNATNTSAVTVVNGIITAVPSMTTHGSAYTTIPDVIVVDGSLLNEHVRSIWYSRFNTFEGNQYLWRTDGTTPTGAYSALPQF